MSTILVAGRNRTSMTDENPIPPEYVARMHGTMGVLDDVFNGAARGADRKTGIVLLIFPMNGPVGEANQGTINYMSNGPDREDVKAMLKELLARWDGQPLNEGHA